MKVFQPSDYHQEFDPEAYLKFYYSSEALSSGTRLSLFTLPMFAKIIQDSLPEDQRLCMIDIGSGPTIYSAICFRNTVKRVYLTDFCDSNLQVLQHWLAKTRPFDWSSVIRIIANCEGLNMNNKEVIVNQVEEKTRNVVLNGGIVHANVHHHEVLDKNVFRDQKFDILVSIFCLEILLIRPGGCLILGSVIEDTTYNSGITKIGNPKIFSVLYLSEKQIFNCIEATGLFDMSTIRKYSLESVMFLMVVKKGL